ncbi:hypothetical protein BDN71DRAFT_1453135, partial [Pleurotus eryngii]
MGAHDEAEGAQFNIIICSGYLSFGEAREVVAPSCFRRAEGEGPRGPATAGWLSCK